MTTHISKALSALSEAYEHAKTQQERDELRSRIAAQSYKEEADREGSHRRNTQKGRAHAATLSLDELVAQFDDPTKIAALSDGGRGAKAITDSLSDTPRHGFDPVLKKRLLNRLRRHPDLQKALRRAVRDAAKNRPIRIKETHRKKILNFILTQ